MSWTIWCLYTTEHICRNVPVILCFTCKHLDKYVLRFAIKITCMLGFGPITGLSIFFEYTRVLHYLQAVLFIKI
jgi:hypothetical protein